MNPNPYQSPASPNEPGERKQGPSFWFAKPPWIVSLLVTVFVTYAPVCAVIVYESDVFLPYTLQILMGYPCQVFTPVLIVVGTVLGRKNVAALAFTSSVILAITSFMAFVLYCLRDA